MNRSEIATLLTTAAAYDNRTIGESDVEAWWQVLARYELEDAMCAVVEHYGANTDRIMPAHVATYCRKAGNEREARRALPAPERADTDVIERVRRELPPYEVRDQDGALLWRGPAKDLAARVAKYPDLVARLKAPPLSMTQGWNGYVPPLVAEHTVKGTTIVNDSPIRAELVEIVRETRTREKAAAAAGNHHTEQEQAS